MTSVCAEVLCASVTRAARACVAASSMRVFSPHVASEKMCMGWFQAASVGARVARLFVSVRDNKALRRGQQKVNRFVYAREGTKTFVKKRKEEGGRRDKSWDEPEPSWSDKGDKNQWEQLIWSESSRWTNRQMDKLYRLFSLRSEWKEWSPQFSPFKSSAPVLEPRLALKLSPRGLQQVNKLWSLAFGPRGWVSELPWIHRL